MFQREGPYGLEGGDLEDLRGTVLRGDRRHRRPTVHQRCVIPQSAVSFVTLPAVALEPFPYSENSIRISY